MRWALFSVSLLLILDTLLIRTISNPNLGVYLPLLLGLPTLLIAVFYRPCLDFFAHGFGRAVKSILICGYALFFAGFAVVCSILSCNAGKLPDPGAQAVIVLGAGLKDGKPSATLGKRLDKALEYAEENPEALLVVTGGLGNNESITEASAMAQYLQERGIAPERILREETSTSTEENLRNAHLLLQERMGQVGPVVVATSDFHVFRALRVAKRNGFCAQGLASTSLWYLKPNFYLREYAAVVDYWIQGRL